MDENTDKWIETVKTAQYAGLDHTIPRQLAITAAEKDLKQKTNIALSRRSFLFPSLPWKDKEKSA